MELKDLKTREKAKLSGMIKNLGSGHNAEGKGAKDKLIDNLIGQVTCTVITAQINILKAVPIIGDITIRGVIAVADAARLLLGKSRLKDDPNAKKCDALAPYL
ncbi:MAG: hypothetical protein FK734_11875 [Asgard group archaeon]|nr:hypothetical protein [Asgard group archaeon]